MTAVKPRFWPDKQGATWECPNCKKVQHANAAQAAGVSPLECPCGWRIQGDLGSLGLLQQGSPPGIGTPSSTKPNPLTEERDDGDEDRGVDTDTG